MADDQGFEDEGPLVLEQRSAIVPEWVIDAPISDCAFRLYAVLLLYGQTSGQRMPGRALLAKRLHKDPRPNAAQLGGGQVHDRCTAAALA